MSREDGGQAFSHTGSGTGGDWSHRGMSLRDYFAGQALVGILTLADESRVEAAPKFCRVAYEFADAMLAERSKP